MGIFVKHVGCKGIVVNKNSNGEIFDKRFVECGECPCIYNRASCVGARKLNGLKIVFE